MTRPLTQGGFLVHIARDRAAGPRRALFGLGGLRTPVSGWLIFDEPGWSPTARALRLAVNARLDPAASPLLVDTDMTKNLARCTALSILLGIPAGARADAIFAPLMLHEQADLESARHKAVVARNVGIGLTVAGTVLTVLGALGIPCADVTCHGTYGNTSNASALASVAILGVGQAAAAAGVVLWSNGGVRAKRATKTLSLTSGGARLSF